MTKETTLLAVRVEKSVKEQAAQRASGLGVSLAQAVKTFLVDFSNPKFDDDQYMEFYENNPNMIHFDPPLTLDEFGALLQASLKHGKTNKGTDKVSGAGQK